jgi:hypothetical protein
LLKWNLAGILEWQNAIVATVGQPNGSQAENGRRSENLGQEIVIFLQVLAF